MKSKRDISLAKIKIIQYYATTKKNSRYKQEALVYNRVVLPQTPEAICVIIDGKIINPDKVIRSLVRDGHLSIGKNDKIEVEPIKIIKNISKTTYKI